MGMYGAATPAGQAPQEYQLNGTVTHVDQAGHEPADWSWHRPRIVLLFLWVVGIYLFVKEILNSRSSSSGLSFFLFGYWLRGKKEVPVQYFRVRDHLEREHLVRRKGYLDGHVMPGDNVELWGRLRDGILYLSRGTNLTTGASLTVRQSCFRL